MAKFFGAIGYAESKETAPGSGVYVDVITEHNYCGDVLKNMSRTREGDKVNDDFVVDNRLSIVSDMFAYNNIQSMRYVTWLGARWKITSVEVQRPRLLLNIGGVYNGPIPIPDPEVPNE